MSNHPCNHFNRLHFSYIFFSNSLNKLNYTEVLPNLTFNAKCQTFVVFFRSICNWPYELVYRYAVANIQIASLSRQQTTNVFNYTHLHSLSLYIHISTFYHSHLWRFSLLLSVKRIGYKNPGDQMHWIANGWMASILSIITTNKVKLANLHLLKMVESALKSEFSRFLLCFHQQLF